MHTAVVNGGHHFLHRLKPRKRAIAGRTAWCRCKFRYVPVSNITMARVHAVPLFFVLLQFFFLIYILQG